MDIKGQEKYGVVTSRGSRTGLVIIAENLLIRLNSHSSMKSDKN